MLQRPTVEELHRDEMLSVMLAYLVDRADTSPENS
jgi:hypothetical protein